MVDHDLQTMRLIAVKTLKLFIILTLKITCYMSL